MALLIQEKLCMYFVRNDRPLRYTQPRGGYFERGKPPTPRTTSPALTQTGGAFGLKPPPRPHPHPPCPLPFARGPEPLRTPSPLPTFARVPATITEGTQ